MATPRKDNADNHAYLHTGAAHTAVEQFLEHLTFEKVKCSNAARECSAPQRGVDSAANRIFGRMAPLKCLTFQR
ncbi:hypothetical protein KL86DES1_21225 [uncultured Desulfovibrio sp.]|uniref:Uncharacterized protein n=1 Tax=uncultured Desulfovibrio sp. TaxID=167968 RepID=A0A212L714_9BACT|nr:hypothetical protein KL86DES1_21225 [uncultured Desulfovibrio sp.]VZH34121.1 conserved protein of unknown function [Desulfovibrio sp. 86]